MERRKPKLLVIGHARHGKDTAADMMKNLMDLDFTSSSIFVGRECIWPFWGEERYGSFDEMFEDRVNFRSTWANLILAYNTPDLSRTATEMLRNNDMYVGMRNKAELLVCKENQVFDYIIWVDASARLPAEPKTSNQLVVEDADLLIDNNGPEVNMHIAINNLQKRLHDEGYDVNFVPVPEEAYALSHSDMAAIEADKQEQAMLERLTEDDPSLRIYRDDPGDMDDPMVVNPTFEESRTFRNTIPKTNIAEDLETFEGQKATMTDESDLMAEQVIVEGAYRDKEGNPLPYKNWTDMPALAVSVLDHGFFKVLEVMGSDETICDSARMSYGRGTKQVNNNQGLINYLVSHYHTSPLEMAEIRFHIRMPIFVMRQWVRHRTANLNEYSGRYSEMVPLFYVPEHDQICLQDKVNKQGSAEPMNAEAANIVEATIRASSEEAFQNYQYLLDIGVSRETARIILPLNTYTEVVWKLDVSNLIKFLWLRDDDHAQWEIQQYAKLVSEAVEKYFPLVFAAYKKARASTTLTEHEIIALVTGNYDDLSSSQAKKIDDLRGNAVFNAD